ncbi:MAG TPA: hypothetical protein VJ743_02375, partial [Albitalea sp.]|nr:hypothetical protein [Albitalea sp.]
IVARSPDDRDAGLQLSTNYTTLGEYLMQRDMSAASAQQALDSFEKGLALLQRLSDKNPLNTALARHVAVTRDSIGSCLLRLHKPGDAVAQHQRALQIMNELVAKDPASTTFRIDQAGISGALSEALRAAGDVQGAVAAARTAVGGFDALPPNALQESDTRYRQALSRFQLGDALLTAKQRPAACETYRQALPMFEALEKELGDTGAGNVQAATVREAIKRCE